VRYTGVSLVYQIGAIIFLAPVPILATLLVALNGNRPWWLAVYLLFGCVVSALSASLMRRTFGGAAVAAASVPAQAPTACPVRACVLASVAIVPICENVSKRHRNDTWKHEASDPRFTKRMPATSPAFRD